MQIFGLQNIYKLANYSLQQKIGEESLELRDWGLLRSRGIAIVEIQKITGMSRATYYRRKKAVSLYAVKGFLARSRRSYNVRKSKISQTLIDLVLKLRRENPTYGKAKLSIILRRDHAVTISENSVGRILSKLIKDGKVNKYHRARYSKKKRTFKSHAKKWQYGMKAKKAGEFVQIDHMNVTRNACSFKHFQTWDPVTKVIVADTSSNAKSLTASKFLRKLIKELPFKLKSVQVDRVSKFMKDFELECEKLGISYHYMFCHLRGRNLMLVLNVAIESLEKSFITERIY